jgi:hypothetical protein
MVLPASFLVDKSARPEWNLATLWQFNIEVPGSCHEQAHTVPDRM